MTKKEIIKKIRQYLKEQEAYIVSTGMESGMAYDEDTNEGYANILLQKALELL